MTDYNTLKSAAAAQARVAREAAEQVHRHRRTQLHAGLSQLLQPHKLAFDAETAAAVTKFRAERAALWEQQARALAPEAYARYEAGLAHAEAELAQAREAAQAPLREFEAQWSARKAAKPRRVSADESEAQALVERDWAQAVASGVPCTAWARWFHITDWDPQGESWHQYAPQRERWLALHPEHRPLLEEATREQWEIVFAE